MRDEIAEQYVAGRLGEEERQAFEAHYFECERCFEELTAYQLAHAELARTGTWDDAQTARPTVLWRWLAAAAVVVLGVGLWSQWPIEAPSTPSVTAIPSEPETPATSLAALAAVTPPPYQSTTLRSTPDVAMRRFRDAMARYERGDYTGTIAELHEADRAGPGRSYVQFYLGVSYLLIDDPDRAIPELQSVVALGQSAYVEDAHFFLAKAFLRKADVSAARAELEKTIPLRGDREGEARALLEALDRFRGNYPGKPRSAVPTDITNWWPGEGSAADLAGNDDGTVRGNVAFTSGVVGRAFSFDGRSLVSIPDHGSVNLTAAGSISFWLFLDVADDGQAILYKGTMDTGQASYGWATEGGLLRFDLYKGDGSPAPDYANVFLRTSDVVGQWTHLVASWDGDALEVYRDGQLITDVHGRRAASYGHFTRIETPVFFLVFGGDQGRRSCKCKLDEIQLFGRALSPSEVTTLFAHGR